MRERYFFDKRDMKHFFKKYGIMMLIAFPIVIALNVLFNMWFEIESMVFLNIIFLCVIFTIGEFICFMWKRKRENKESNKEKN